MFSSIIGKFKEITSPAPNQRYEESVNNQDNDIEEDGFLVLGETESDRTAIHGSEFDVNTINAPPTYNQVMTPPVLDNSYPPVFPSLPQTTAPPGGDRASVPPKTAISDIPFQLSSRLALIKDIHDNPAYSLLCDTQNNDFSWTKYNYDFTNEISFLNEYNSGNFQNPAPLYNSY